MNKKKLFKQSKMWCPKELNYIVDCKNKHCSIEEMAECWKPILDKNELEEAFTKVLIIEKLENEIKRIEIEYKNDEDLSYEYLEGLTSGLRNAIQIINNL